MSGTARITCGHFGGKNRRGDPCGIASVDGPCTKHRMQVLKDRQAEDLAKQHASISDILDPDFGFRVPPFERFKDKVAIVGFTDHRVEALKLDDSWEIWGLNELYRYMPVDRFHRWFEIHGREYLCQDEDGQKHIEDLKTMLGDVPIYMQQRHEDIPGSVKFPLEEMCKTLDSEYFTNCPAEMIGLAIAMGYKAISVYGVDMATESEYGSQRCCCEHWLGVAKGRGIDVYVPDVSDLLKCIGIYGYEDKGSVFSRKLQERLKWLHSQDNDRLTKIRSIESQYRTQHAELTERINRAEGAVAELKTHRKSAVRDERIAARQGEADELHATVKALVAEYEHKHAALLGDRNQIVGGIHNTEYLLRSWGVKTSSPGGGNIPTAEQRSADPRVGPLTASDDSVPTEPAGVYQEV